MQLKVKLSVLLKSGFILTVIMMIPIAIAKPQQQRNFNYGRRQLALVVPPRGRQEGGPREPDFGPQSLSTAGGDDGLSSTRKVIQTFGEELQNLDQQSNFETPNYDFKYQVHGGGNLFGHEESRKDYKANGKYHVLLPDGRRQIVTYYADETGYYPTITYEVVPNANTRDNSEINSLQKDNGYRSKRSRHYRHSKRVRSDRLKKQQVLKNIE